MHLTLYQKALHRLGAELFDIGVLFSKNNKYKKPGGQKNVEKEKIYNLWKILGKNYCQ